MSVKNNEGSKNMMECTKEKAENQIWRYLPLELLSSVMTYLEIKDNVRASVVCKSWYEAAVSVRVIDRSPWLMCFPQTKNTYEFYDPSNSKKYAMELPKSLVGSIVRYSKDGWVLMSKEDSSDFVLFNPLSMDLVVLPDLQLWNYYQLVGFSCAPTSSECVVFTIKDYDPGHVTIRTWSPGQTMWTSMQVESQFLDVEDNKVVFLNGVFYCLNRRNWLAVFDPSLRTWNALAVRPPICPDEDWNGGRFMVGYKGDIFVICTYENKDPLLFQLDLARGTWEKNVTLGSLTIFVSSKSCESRTYVNKGMLRNSVYFPMLSHGEKRCVAYSVHERRYHHPREHNLDWGNQLSSNDFWIEPPKNVFELI